MCGIFGYVGTRDEARGFARPEHDAPGRIDRQALDQRVQLDQHVLRECVDCLSGPIDGHQHDPVGSGFDLPVSEAEPVETSGRLTCHHEDDPARYGAQYHPVRI